MIDSEDRRRVPVRAIVQDRYGPSDVLRLAEVSTPPIRPDEVLVRVHAASMHADVRHAVTGDPLVVRVMGSGLRRPKQPIPGNDVSGVVVEVGASVSGFGVGDEVFGEVTRRQIWANGGAFADYVAAPAMALAHKPGRLSHVEAAAVPTSGLIAVQVVEDEGRVSAGQSVLVNGAAGGVGVFAVQLARAAGATVTAVDHVDKFDVLRQIGADALLDYTVTDVTEGDARYDVFIDVAGTRKPGACRRVIAKTGTYVLVGHEDYDASRIGWIGSLGTFAGMIVQSPFVSQYHLRLPRPRQSRMQRLVDLIEVGAVSPVVDRTFPLEQTAQALDYLASGRVRGKIVIEMVAPAA